MKRRTAAMMAAILMATAVTGCSNCGKETTQPAESTSAQNQTEGKQEEKKEEKKDGEVVELKVFGFKTATEQEPIDLLVEEFNAANPGIHVTYEGISTGGGYEDVLTSRLASGQADDVIFANTNFIVKLQKSGYLEDLSGLEAAKNYNVSMELNGEIPGLSMEQSVFGMFVNNDVVKECGVEIPTNYEEFLAACEQIKAAGKTPLIAGSQDGTGAGIIILSSSLNEMYRSGNPEEEIKAMNTGETKIADVLRPGFERAEEIKEKGYVDAEKMTVFHPLTDSLAEFAKGETAFMTMGNWAIKDFKKTMPDADISFVGLPFSDREMVLADPGVRLCINKQSTHKEEAAQFIEFMLKPENNDRYVAAQNAFSVLKNGTSTSDPIVENVAAILKEGNGIPWADARFDVLNAWALSKEFGANLWAGSDLDTALSDLSASAENTIALQ